MTTITALLANTAYGFPTRGSRRRVAPVVLVCVHLTGNATNLGPTAATNAAMRTGPPAPARRPMII